MIVIGRLSNCILMKKGEWFLHGKAWGAEPSDDKGKDEEEKGVAAHQLPLQIKIKMATTLKGKKSETIPAQENRNDDKDYLTCALKNFCRDPKMKDCNLEHLDWEASLLLPSSALSPSLGSVSILSFLEWLSASASFKGPSITSAYCGLTVKPIAFVRKWNAVFLRKYLLISWTNFWNICICKWAFVEFLFSGFTDYSWSPNLHWDFYFGFLFFSTNKYKSHSRAIC